MKPVALVIAGLVASNLVLAGVILWRPSSVTEPAVRAIDAAAPTPAQSSSVVTMTDPGGAWQALRHDDLALFSRNLRNAGLADHLVRAIIVAEIDERFRAREESLVPKRPSLKYWQYNAQRESLEIRLARLDLKREKARLRIEVLGPDPSADIESSIPSNKLELARMITEDYDTVLGALRTGPSDMLLPIEKSTIENIEADRRRELAALLTPEELTEYHFRTSWNMQQLRQQLATFDASEEEFRSIYDIRQGFEDKFNRGPHDIFGREGETEEQRNARMIAAQEARQVAERQVEEDLRRTLGDERYRTYQRETDGHLHALRALAERAGVPRANAEQLHDLRAALALESERIIADATSSVEARTTALRTLGGAFRAQALMLLGPDATTAYLATANWLRFMEQGQAIRFTANGWGGTRIIATPPPAKP